MKRAGADVVVIGAGMVGAACAYYARLAGLTVTVIDRAGVSGGTTGAGEGNILVSDKGPGPELDLALRSQQLWLQIGQDLGVDEIELEVKGAFVVTASPAEQTALDEFAAQQRASGVRADRIPTVSDVEPHLASDLCGGMFYPQDMQVQPMLAAARLLRASGATLRLGETVTGIEKGRVITDQGVISTGAVVNAAGTWSAQIAAMAGVDLPIMPRRGFVLVTEPLPQMVRHKVYSAGYVGNVGSDSADLQVSAVVEGTQAGTILIGASRERVGFDPAISLPVLRLLAAGAVRLFPFLKDVHVIRAYRGFRPYSPDHLPIIGADSRVDGLYHACGHEGAGIGLAPITGQMIAAQLTGEQTVPANGASPFGPERFA